MKTNVPAFLARQHALTNEEWIKMIRVQAFEIGKNLNNLTLKTLGELGIIFDDYGRHALRDNSGKCGFARGYEPSRQFRAIYPLEDDKISVNEFTYDNNDSQNNKPIGVIQRLWGYSGSKSWVTIEVRSDITYLNQHPHVNTRWAPKLVGVTSAQLNDDFFKFVGLTPKQFYYRFSDSIRELLKKRKEFLFEVLEMEKSIARQEFMLEQIPGGARELFE
jgi:hypothetical protein